MLSSDLVANVLHRSGPGSAPWVHGLVPAWRRMKFFETASPLRLSASDLNYVEDLRSRDLRPG
jgi:hypothetical protein